MANSTKDFLKILPFESMTEMEERSDELLRKAFDKLELANHYRLLLKHERFSHHLARFHHPWGVSIQGKGNEQPFVTAQIDPNTEAVSATVNKDLLRDTKNQELIEPVLAAMMRSINEEFRSLLGLDGQIPSALTPRATLGEGGPPKKKVKKPRGIKKSG